MFRFEIHSRRWSQFAGLLLGLLLLTVVTPALAGDDGRINPGAVEAAIYCTTEGVKVIDIDRRGVGTAAFTVPYTVIDAVMAPEENTLLAAHRGFRLYRLTTGELQLNAPPNDSFAGEYVFTWDGCDASEIIQP